MDIANEGKKLMKCSGCNNPMSAAWFCDKDCQKSFWNTHKNGNCGQPRGPGMAIMRVEYKDGSIAMLACEATMV